jgi:hypothetical protein
MAKTVIDKDREAAQAAASEIPTDVLEEELKKRSAESQRIEALLEFLRTSPEGYKQFGHDIEFDAEDLIEFLRRNWHQCLLSSAVEFKDVEGWLRRIIFGKTDGTKTTLRLKK